MATFKSSQQTLRKSPILPYRLNTHRSTNLSLLHLTRSRWLQLHTVRLFTNNLKDASSKSSSSYHRTFNPHLPSFYKNLGFNANPFKVAVCGAVGGLCGAMCGVGGGIVMIPLLRNITSMTPHQVTGTSLVAVTVGAMFATAVYQVSSDVTRVPIALNMALFSMACSVLGARVNKLITGKTLSRVTGLTLMGCIPLILYQYDPSIPPPGRGSHAQDIDERLRKHIEEEKFYYDNTQQWYARNWHFCAIGAIAGFASGLIGIGGGVIMTAVMSAATDLSQHEAVATSLLCIAPTALIGSLMHYRMKHVVLPIAMILGTSCVAGMSVAPFIAL
eukprot:CAMPEP_0197044770 /NCGR_PEP_ID=MMETSP1384-20130603/20756_1 /TAXON_ID=29189 /ORGANISM="Ammonia sp." /LENGTH=330 /DNA_ID=CAMNT_0042476281 /DNA_START=16 /DNA_END=1004 /DNA_ORIENTATION=+